MMGTARVVDHGAWDAQAAFMAASGRVLGVEPRRVAFTVGVPQAVRDGQTHQEGAEAQHDGGDHRAGPSRPAVKKRQRLCGVLF